MKKKKKEIWKKMEDELVHKRVLLSRNSKITLEYYIR